MSARIKHGFHSLVVVVGASVGALAGCSGGGQGSGPAQPAPAARPAPPQAHVVSVDEALDVPSFTWLLPPADPALRVAPGKDPVDASWNTLRAVAPSLKLSPAAIDHARVTHVHDTGRGAIVTRFGQSLDGIDVFNAQLNMTLRRDLTPLAVTGSLAPSLHLLSTQGWPLDARAAITAAYQTLSTLIVSPAGLTALGSDQAGYDRFVFSVATPTGNALVHGRAKRVLFPEAKGVWPAWLVDLDAASDRTTNSQQHAYVIRAHDGATLFDNDLVASDVYTYRVWADHSGPKGIAPLETPYGNGITPNVPGVYDPNAVEPPYLFSSLETLSNIPFATNDPWLPPNAAELAGNNVHAYADLVPPDGLTASSRDRIVVPTSPGIFDRYWDPTTLPPANNINIDAVTTDLFFVINYMHDLFYDSGYTETAGNAQNDNFSRGGAGGDAINAESQDFSGYDNANCSTPPDGRSPRIQMYLWDFLSNRSVTINAPDAIKQTLSATVGIAAFGPPTWTTTGNVVLAVDAAGGKNIGCNQPTPGQTSTQPVFANPDALKGNIALIDRGTCTFVEKALNAKAAGAIGVLFVNLASTDALRGLGAYDPNLIDFPGNMIQFTDGAAIKAQLAAGTPVNATLFRDYPTRDGSVDGSIMSHEWGHSLSNRLINNGTGLPANTQSSGMGEGWSDFVALLTYTRATDLNVASNANWNGVYPLGTYALGGQPADIYYGIRRYPYSYDMSKDPLTFKHIQNGIKLPTTPPPHSGADGASNAEVHATGEVWASMLWDCYVSLLRDTANYDFESASKQMRDYLVAALKMTPTNPTFTEARDALLLAAFANSAKPNDFIAFAQAFARRGAGMGAISPLRTSSTNVAVTESFVTGNNVALGGATIDDDVASCDHDHILDNGETGTVTVTLQNVGIYTLTAATAKLSSTNPAVSFPQGNTVTFPSTTPYASSQAKVQIALAGASGQTTIDLQVDLDAPDLVPTPGPRSSTVSFYANYDWVPATSATDLVDEPTTSWTASHDSTLYAADWSRVTTTNGPIGAAWFDRALPFQSDQYLTSPPLHVGAGAFGMSFRHHYSFEFAGNVAYDGGVVELSADNGATWTDIGVNATANGYNVTMVPLATEPQPIAGRKAFGKTNSGYPADVITTLDLGTTWAGQTVLVRFRAASDDGGASVGWTVDDIAFTGLGDTPFPSRGAQSASCQPPVANAGAAQTVNEGTLVTLDGSGSSAAAGKTLHYSWSQLSGPAATLSDAHAVKPTFTAPLVDADSVLRFQLLVDDGTLTSLPATVDITDKDVPVVVPPPDMAVGPDMTVGPDMALGPDMAVGPDMATPPHQDDMATGGGTPGDDMATAPPADMAKPAADMAQGHDMGGGGNGGCSCDVTGHGAAPTSALPLAAIALVLFWRRRRLGA